VQLVDDIERALSRYFQCRSPLGFFEQSRATQHRTELLRPLVAGDSSRQRFESGAVTARKDDGPFIALIEFAKLLHQFFLIGAASMIPRHYISVSIVCTFMLLDEQRQEKEARLG
jgi:hypothetical protein